jgi:hypothetical protein
MKYFGAPGDAPVYEGVDRAPTPVGRKCFSCKEEIRLGDRGFLIPYARPTETAEEPWHRLCFLSDVLGPLAQDLDYVTVSGTTGSGDLHLGDPVRGRVRAIPHPSAPVRPLGLRCRSTPTTLPTSIVAKRLCTIARTHPTFSHFLTFDTTSGVLLNGRQSAFWWLARYVADDLIDETVPRFVPLSATFAAHDPPNLWRI